MMLRWSTSGWHSVRVSVAIPPGWYGDPWQQATYRWWDGGDWTSNISGPAPVLVPRWDPNLPHEDPRVLRERVVRSGRWLRTALLCAVPLQFFTIVALGLGERRTVHDLGRTTDAGTVNLNLSGWLILGQITSFAGTAIVVLRMVWMYRAARLGRQVGIAARREPGLACAGWIIPIVNLWWPYQDLRALGGERAPAARMWTLYILGSVATVTAVVVLIISSGPGVVCAVVATAVLAAAALAEREVVATIEGVLSERVPTG